ERPVHGRPYVADGLDLHFSPKNLVHEVEQLVLVHRGVGDEVVRMGGTQEPVVECRSLHDPFAELRKLESGYAVPAVVCESLDLTSVLVREEPVEEAGVVLQLGPDDGAPDIEHGAVEHLAEALRLAVDVERIVWIALHVLSSG